MLPVKPIVQNANAQQSANQSGTELRHLQIVLLDMV
jgi:hypothetical protein